MPHNLNELKILVRNVYIYLVMFLFDEITPVNQFLERMKKLSRKTTHYNLHWGPVSFLPQVGLSIATLIGERKISLLLSMLG